MKNIDYLSLGGHNLKTFITVLNELSVSRAADRLGVTQSTVSHSLEKLRIALGDDLFVRSGRGITATEKALSLQQPVQEILDNLQALTYQRSFSPSLEKLDFSIAANDYPRDLIFPKLLQKLNQEGIDAHFNFPLSGIPSVKMLQQNKCQMIITPFIPDSPNLYQTKLFDDELVCFYDDSVREAPSNKADFFKSDFIQVQFHDNKSDIIKLSMTNTFELPKASVSVPSFNAISSFLSGSKMICVAISNMRETCLKGFSTAPLPFKTDRINVYQVWHQRDNNNPAHKWLRNEIKKTVNDLFQEQSK